MDYKKLVTNAVLAGVAAFTGAIAVSSGKIDKALVVAAAYAGVRVAAGAIAAGIKRPVSVDK